jgi:D-alanyl-D-alanine carboxypeptidase/D-alanyl-D-alanine-endopeptidase (penicillin-binding protein 4)
MSSINTKRIMTLGLPLIVVLCANGLISAQSAPQVPVSPSPPAIQQAPVISPLPALTSTPIYGLQGVLIETLDGKAIAAQEVEQPLNPASAIKLATTLVALKTFGPRHRFSTGVWTNGTFNKSNGTINGNLYISGRDPSFHYEHAIEIAQQLNQLGIKTVTGDLFVSPGFTMNFNWSAKGSGERLYDTFDATLRSKEATNAWTIAKTTSRSPNMAPTNPSVAVMGDVYVSPVARGARLLLTHQSSKLTDILKVLLCYSNNFMAERLGESLGGAESVENSLTKSLGLNPEEFRISTLSGLGTNRVSPRAMMKVFRALREELRKHRMSTTDIMPVAGIDPGTMEERFNDFAWRGSVIAKTGTLIRTDGGASSLVGQMRTASGEIMLFVIFNQRGSVDRFRDNQDFLIKQVQSSRGGPRAFKYNPLPLSLKLLDTRSKVGESPDEYEPVMATGNSPE